MKKARPPDGNPSSRLPAGRRGAAQHWWEPFATTAFPWPENGTAGLRLADLDNSRAAEQRPSLNHNGEAVIARPVKP